MAAVSGVLSIYRSASSNIDAFLSKRAARSTEDFEVIVTTSGADVSDNSRLPGPPPNATPTRPSASERLVRGLRSHLSTDEILAVKY